MLIQPGIARERESLLDISHLPSSDRVVVVILIDHHNNSNNRISIRSSSSTSQIEG